MYNYIAAAIHTIIHGSFVKVLNISGVCPLADSKIQEWAVSQKHNQTRQAVFFLAFGPHISVYELIDQVN